MKSNINNIGVSRLSQNQDTLFYLNYSRCIVISRQTPYQIMKNEVQNSESRQIARHIEKVDVESSESRQTPPHIEKNEVQSSESRQT